MTTTIAFFSNKGGVGKTTLVYHLAHMFADLGHRLLLLDLDPQSNLTAMCLPEEELEEIWTDPPRPRRTVLEAVRPILKGEGDLAAPSVIELSDAISLVPGDLGLSAFEDQLSDAWPRALDRDEAAFRTLSAFHRLAKLACHASAKPEWVLMDVGPNLGAISRAALLAADFVITPLAPDLFSIQGLRNLGPTLETWRAGWQERRKRNPDPELELPSGALRPLGYIVMQAGLRGSRPVKAYDRWVAQIPDEYAHAMLGLNRQGQSFDTDPSFLGVMRHYQSLMPLAQDAQRPMFHLRPGDGAIGSHMEAVRRCGNDFRGLANRVLERVRALNSEGG
jgi:cellulose biosynthesis protein BcsQ